MRENMTTEETLTLAETSNAVPDSEVPDPEVPETDAEDCGDEVDCVDEEEAKETEQIKAELKERERLPDSPLPDKE